MVSGRVTVVVPVYNDRPTYINEAVASLKAQTYHDIEIVVVDDGSTAEPTTTALDNLRGVRLLKQTNSGTGAALNAGVRAGTGEYILALGADDKIDPFTIEVLQRTLTEGGPSTVIAYPIVEKFGTEVGQIGSPPSARFEDVVLFNSIVATALISRENWDLGGGFDQHNDSSEDWVLWATVLGRTHGLAVRADKRATLRYRRTGHSQNVRNRSAERVQNARQHILENLPDRAGDMYLATAASAALIARERDGLRADAGRWRRLARVFPPHWSGR